MNTSHKGQSGQKITSLIVISLLALFLFMISCSNQEQSNGSSKDETTAKKPHDRIVYKGKDPIDFAKTKSEILKKIDDAMAKPQEENGWYNYEEASLSLNLTGCDNIVLLADEKVTEKNLDLVTKLVNQNEKVFEMVDKGYGKPDFQVPINYEEGSAARVPNFLKLRSLTSLLVVSGNLEKSKGNYPQAATRYLQALRLGQGVAKNGTLIFGMIGVAFEKKALPALNELLKEDGILKDTCNLILQEVIKMNSERISFKDLLDCELLFVEITLDNIRDGKYDTINEFKIFADASVREKTRDKYENWYANMVDSFRYEYPELIENFESQNIVNDESPENIFIPNVTKAYKQFTISTARYQGVITMAALRLYNSENSGYPACLDKLTPQYIEKTPVDPYTGKSLAYMLKGNGFILYSIGPDLRDDGSVPATDNINTNGDLVFNSGIN